MGRDFWILTLPVLALFAGASAMVLTRDGAPFAATCIYLGLHSIIYCRRLAPYLHTQYFWSPYSDGGDIWGPPSPLRVAAMGALMAIAGSTFMAFQAAEWLGIIEIQFYWNGEPR